MLLKIIVDRHLMSKYLILLFIGIVLLNWSIFINIIAERFCFKEKLEKPLLLNRVIPH